MASRVSSYISQLAQKFWCFLLYRVWGDYKQGGLCGLYHWIRCHVWNRYHVINISGIDGYHWGWIDRDRALLYANFQILQDFVEKEDITIGLRLLEDFGPKDDWEKEFLTNQLKREQEIRAIYNWWVYDRPTNRQDLEANYSWDLEEELDKQDEEMLIRLAKVRLCLWT